MDFDSKLDAIINERLNYDLHIEMAEFNLISRMTATDFIIHLYYIEQNNQSRLHTIREDDQ